MKRLKLKRNKEVLKSLLLFMWLTNGLQITVGDTWKWNMMYILTNSKPVLRLKQDCCRNYKIYLKILKRQWNKNNANIVECKTTVFLSWPQMQEYHQKMVLIWFQKGQFDWISSQSNTVCKTTLKHRNSLSNPRGT